MITLQHYTTVTQVHATTSIPSSCTSSQLQPVRRHVGDASIEYCGCGGISSGITSCSTKGGDQDIPPQSSQSVCALCANLDVGTAGWFSSGGWTRPCSLRVCAIINLGSTDGFDLPSSCHLSSSSLQYVGMDSQILPPTCIERS